MNNQAINLNLSNTYYANPHGLENKASKSTAYDQAQLAFAVCQNKMIQKIIQTKIYFSKIFRSDQTYKDVYWENTNKLLYQGFSGIKTGVTNTAGPCLASWYKDDKQNYFVILLSSRSMDDRWQDTEELVNWAQNKFSGIQ